MSKQTVVRNQASRSHQEDALGKPQHTKASQRPLTPAHESVRESIDVDEAKGGVKKVVRDPGHVGPQNRPGEERDSLNEKQIARIDRSHPGDAREISNGAAKARKAGPHGNQIDASGDNNAAPKKRHLARIG